MCELLLVLAGPVALLLLDQDPCPRTHPDSASGISCPCQGTETSQGRREGKLGALPLLCPHLIDAKANGVHVLAHLPLPPPVLLDEAYQEGTATLPVLLILVLLLQLDQILRVHPESVCSREGSPALSRSA